jgi:hypothetical protein
MTVFALAEPAGVVPVVFTAALALAFGATAIARPVPCAVAAVVVGAALAVVDGAAVSVGVAAAV